jgi:hypothetical protein
LIVRAGRTDGDLLNSALEALYGVVVHGLVLNAVEPGAMRGLAPVAPPRPALPPRRT